MPSTEELLASLPDFRSLDFWEQFFKAQKNQAFEWYGSYSELAKLLRRLVPASSRVLVPGCGNSDLSAGLYDQGCQDITNIDFSKPVIMEMMRKNLRERPSMKWQVMDMTATKFGDRSFDVVLDKGSLDALMGEDSPEAATAGRCYLRETARLLRSSGSFLCITLGQRHVLQQLLQSFPLHWTIHIHPVPPSPDMLSRPVQPVMVQVAAQPAPACGEAAAVKARMVQHSLGQIPAWAPNKEQIQDILQAVEAENSRRQDLTPEQMQATSQGSVVDRFAELQPGRHEPVSLPEGSPDQDPGPRFTATVVDVSAGARDAAVRDCCIFIMPQGQEQAWVFASPEGQQQVAAQCMSRRVILIGLNRGHSFGNLQAVQSELSPLVLPLAPEAAREAANAIPFMTSQEGLGSRTVLQEAESALSGRIVVEDVQLPPSFAEEHKPPKGAVARRMVFLSNQGLVQSEALMAPLISRQQSAAGGSKGNQGKQGQPNGSASDSSPVASHMKLVVDQLLSQYHKAIVAGLALSWDDVAAAQHRRALVIGLGGGCLPMYMRHILGLSVQVVELDPVVADLASHHFGFVADEQLQVGVQDGLDVIRQASSADPSSASSKPDMAAREQQQQQANPEPFDFLIIDAGSGDASLPMSCPPPSFLEPGVLKSMAAALKPQGLLAMNCVSRSDAAFREAVAAVQAAFGSAWMIDIEDEVNRVVFAIKNSAAQASLKLHNRTSSVMSLESRCSSIADDLSAYMDQLELLPASS